MTIVLSYLIIFKDIFSVNLTKNNKKVVQTLSQQLFNNVKQLAKNKGMTLPEVAKKAEMGINSLYHWKQHDPSIDNLQKVADVLGVTVNDLLGKKDHKKKTADLNDEDIIFTYEGRQIPPEDIELMKRLLRGKKE